MPASYYCAIGVYSSNLLFVSFRISSCLYAKTTLCDFLSCFEVLINFFYALLKSPLKSCSSLLEGIPNVTFLYSTQTLFTVASSRIPRDIGWVLSALHLACIRWIRHETKPIESNSNHEWERLFDGPTQQRYKWSWNQDILVHCPEWVEWLEFQQTGRAAGMVVRSWWRGSPVGTIDTWS